MQNAGLIEPCTSPWSANLVIVNKPGSVTPRVTVDLRKLNAITYKEKFPLPVQSEAVDFLSQTKYLSVLDISQSYFTISLDPADRDKTAFLTRRGQYRFCVLPQGATNSPSIFSRLMSLTLRGLSYLCVLSFIDDCIVIGLTFDEHLLNLQLVLNRFRFARLKLKPKKCRLFQSDVRFLGHLVSGNSIRVDLERVACVKSWPFPRDISEVRSFISFCSYYRNFCPNFARVAEPFNAMLRKNVPVVPTAERLRAFEELKSALTSAPALGIFRNEGDIVVDIDASSTSAGAVCQQWQDGHLIVLEYASLFLECREKLLRIA